MTAPPIPTRWNGEAFDLLPQFRKMADREFVIGQVYRLVEQNERSEVSHNHEFAWLKEAWQTLPEHLADEFPTPEHLRKRALVIAGFYTEQIIDCGTRTAALRVAQGLKARPGEEFSVVSIGGPLVVIRTPKSQSRRAMDKAEFQASKTGIMEVIAQMLGVSPAELAKAEAA